MAHVVVLGAGRGGTIIAYELREKLGKAYRISLVALGTKYSFVPSNPWVGVGWRDRESVEVDLAATMGRLGIELFPQGAARVVPGEKRLQLNDGALLPR